MTFPINIKAKMQIAQGQVGRARVTRASGQLSIGYHLLAYP